MKVKPVFDPSKLDTGLRAAYAAWGEAPSDQTDAEIAIAVTFSGDIAELEAVGFKPHATFLEKAYGVVRFEDIPALTALQSVIWLAAGSASRKDLDSAVRDIVVRATNPITTATPTDGLWHADVTSGALTGIPNATGRGVIVAVIDTGIDISHPMFTRQTAAPFTSRILRIWDQGLTPASHADCPADSFLISAETYGVEFNTDEVEAALNGGAAIAHKDCDGHGTHVAGIAAGGVNHITDASRVGVAPEADIIVVKFLDNPEDIFYTLPDGSRGAKLTEEIRFKDAILYCLRTARALGKPIVVNMSFGDGSMPGDGLDDDARFVDGLLDPNGAPSDMAFPQSAIAVKTMGNDGDSASLKTMARIVIPASGELILPVRLFDRRESGQNRSWKNCSRRLHKPELSMYFWYRRAVASLSVRFALRTTHSSNFTAEVMVGGELELGIKRIVAPLANDIADAPSPALHRVKLTHENNPAAAHSPGNVVHRHRVSLKFKPKESGVSISYLDGIHELRIRAPAGTVFFAHGDLEVWDPDGVAVLQIWDRRADGTVLGAPEVEWLTEFTSLDPFGKHAISVAAYTDTADAMSGVVTQQIADFSSRGPLRDYSDPATPLPVFAKPDITAPGVDISSAEGTDTQQLTVRLSAWRRGARFAEHSGTSMAAPMIAGVIALMLQKNASLNVTQVRTALSSAPRPAVEPSTAPASTNAYGAGMVDGTTSYVNTP